MSRRPSPQQNMGRTPAIPAPRFDPTQLSGCVQWLRSDLGVTLASGQVSAWADQSGAHIVTSYAQATAVKRPTYSASGGPNNVPYLTSGASTIMTSATSLLTAGSPRTLFVAARSTNTAVGGAFFENKTAAPTFSMLIYSSLFVYSDSITTNITAPDWPANQASDFVATWSTDTAPSLLMPRFNGAPVDTTTSTVKPDTGTAGSSILNRSDAGAGLGWTGRTYEIIIYNRLLSASEIAKVESYLAARYSVALSTTFYFNNAIVGAPVNQRFPLWNAGQAPLGGGTFEATNATVSVYFPATATATGAGAISCPGDGYASLSGETAEGRDNAKWLASQNILGIALDYRLPAGNPLRPLLDIQRTVRLARSNATAWGLTTTKLGVTGFSAGGHLASMGSVQYDTGNPAAADPIERLSCKPNFSLLMYPMITMQAPYVYSPGQTALLGASPSAASQALYSNNLQVNASTPGAFIATGTADATVDPHNSQLYNDALVAAGVPVTYLQISGGVHGLGGPGSANWTAWENGALTWLRAQGYIP